jgi:tetratricopeptide (TPR) repeat protein
LRIGIPKGRYRPIFFEPSSEPATRKPDESDARASALGLARTRDDDANPNKPRVPTADSQAGDCYYRARYASQQRDAAMFAKAIELFRKAIAVDPNFAQAYASLAGTLLNIAGFVSSPSGPLTCDAVAADDERLRWIRRRPMPTPLWRRWRTASSGIGPRPSDYSNALSSLTLGQPAAKRRSLMRSSRAADFQRRRSTCSTRASWTRSTWACARVACRCFPTSAATLKPTPN